MKKTFWFVLALLLSANFISAQKVEFEEYTLKNGLQVVLHQDNSAPVVVTSVMYHVGSKDENPERTGFAHFFEHLLFEGTKNIERGEWFKIVSANGGSNNANTSADRTYYYEVFPSNNLELGLWLESERLMHPVINQIGVDTQNEVVKEEKRLRVDNAPYGSILEAVKKNIFKKHPYRWTVIGEMEHLDAATLEEFQAFNKKFYVPNNAVLVVAGDFKRTQAKEWIEKYFGPIERGADIERVNIQEDPIEESIVAEWEDKNIQLPGYILSYLSPSMKERESKVLDMLSSVLSSGKSSRLYKKLVDDKKLALEVATTNIDQEDYSIYLMLAIPMPGVSQDSILNEIDKEIVKMQTDLITEKEYEKLQNSFETSFVYQNENLENIAHNLATYSLLYGNTNLINTQIDTYRSISREEIRDAARKYLNPNQRLVLSYIPEKKSEK